MSTDLNFQSSAVRPASMIGEGVFGRVYDLRDGTVLKVARDKSAGIGSGRVKINKEFEALTRLQGSADLAGRIALPLGKAAFRRIANWRERGLNYGCELQNCRGVSYMVT